MSPRILVCLISVGALLGVSVGALCADEIINLGHDLKTSVDSYFHASDSQLKELITTFLSIHLPLQFLCCFDYFRESLGLPMQFSIYLN